jgi:hypothetical protein
VKRPELIRMAVEGRVPTLVEAVEHYADRDHWSADHRESGRVWVWLGPNPPWEFAQRAAPTDREAWLLREVEIARQQRDEARDELRQLRVRSNAEVMMDRWSPDECAEGSVVRAMAWMLVGVCAPSGDYAWRHVLPWPPWPGGLRVGWGSVCLPGAGAGAGLRQGGPVVDQRPPALCARHGSKGNRGGGDAA